MNNSFKAQKDISFTDEQGKTVSGRFLTDFEGHTFKVFGHAAETIELGTNYDFSVKKTDAKGVQLIDGSTMKKVGDPTPQAEPKAAYSGPESDKRQASIEAQNARTNLTQLAIADKLSLSEKQGLISSLCLLAGITYDSDFHESDTLRAPRKPNV